jgi:anti-sigma-K factor RskA
MTDDELHSQSYLYVVGALTPDEVREFETHLAECADCRKDVADLSEVTARLSETVAAEPPASLRSAVLAEVADTVQDPRPEAAGHEHAGSRPPRGRHAASTPQAEQASDDAPAPIVPLRRPWQERTAMLVAAAAVVAAVGLSGWALNERSDARDEAATSQRLMDELTSVLNAGDAQTVSSSTKGGAVAMVVRSQSRGVALLLASDLPALPDDKTYQAWTIDGDKPTSAGIFESQGDQTAFDLPPAAVKAGAVAITVEPAGGSGQPTTDPIVALSLG